MRKPHIWIASFFTVVIIYQFCYGLQTLLPGNESWLMTIKHDWGGHYLGWLFYKNEAWHFPIGDVHNYFYPVGTNVGFTDSIPLFAIFFKLLSPILPGDFQYFGIWLFLCHLLTAFYTIKLFRLFKINDLYTFIAVVFIAANPVLIYRGLHPALCAHWLLLASVYVYFLDPKVTSASRILKYQFILLMIAALVNPYICFMVLGFSLAIAVKLCFYDKAILKYKFLIYIGLTALSLFLSGYILGIIRFGESEDIGVAGGYGLYGLNLHSLYNSFGFSSFFKGINQVSPHQYEGFMYLGLGMILLIIAVIVIRMVLKSRGEASSGKVKKERWYRGNRFPLYLLVIFFTLFSISHIVTLDERVIFKIPLPGFILKIGDVFRASARFFWPVYYLILAFTIIVLVKTRLNQTTKTIILGLALLLQLFDTKLLFTYRNLTHGKYELPIDTNKWEALISRFDNVVIYPPFQTTNLEEMDYQYFCWIAGKQGKPITTGYVARVDNQSVKQYNDSLKTILEEGRLHLNSLYITTPAHLNDFSFALQSDSAKLSILNGYYFIYSASKNDSIVNAIRSGLVVLHKQKLDSAMSLLTKRIEFQRTSLSMNPGAVKFNLEEFREREGWISFSGWAFKEGRRDSSKDSVFFVLKNENDVYFAPATLYLRPDITSHFKGQYLENAGYAGRIFTRNVNKGIYQLGIAVKDSAGNYTYTITDKTLRIQMTEFARLEKLDTLPPQIDITYNAETISIDDKSVKIQGWAFLKDQSANDNRIAIILKDNEKIYTASAEPMSRPDVTVHFKSKFDLSNSGFVIKFLRTSIPKGKYELGIFVEDKNGREGMVFTGKELEL